jgi:hypothetical protein
MIYMPPTSVGCTVARIAEELDDDEVCSSKQFKVYPDDDDDDDDDFYLRLQHEKGFHNLVYMSYVKHIKPAKKALIMNTTIIPK